MHEMNQPAIDAFEDIFAAYEIAKSNPNWSEKERLMMTFGHYIEGRDQREQDHAAEVEQKTDALKRIREAYFVGNNGAAADAMYEIAFEMTTTAADKQKCSYWIMRQKGRTNYPYGEHWRDCDACQASDPTGTATGITVDKGLSDG